MGNDDVEYLLKIRDEFSAALDKFEDKSRRAENAGRKLHDSTKHAEGGFHSLKESIVMAGEALAIYELYEFGKEAFMDFAKLQDVTAGINQILKTTHESAGMTAESLHELAEKQQELTIFSARQTMESEKQLLVFTNIRGEIYEKTIPAISDMASFMKVDLKTATDIVGKALNNPAMAARLLRQEGVALSKSQTELLEHLQATGKMAEAQELILGELQKRFGGAGEAAAKTGMGPIKQLANQFEEVKESIGEVISEGLEKLYPYIKEGIEWVKDLIKTMKEADWSPLFDSIKEMLSPLKEIWQNFKAIGEALGIGTDKAGFFSVMIKSLTANIKFALMPMIALVKVGAAIIAKFRNLIEHTAWLKNILSTTVSVVKGFYAAVTEAFYRIGEVGAGIFGGLGKMIKGMFTFSWDEIKKGFSDLKNAFSTYGGNVANAYKSAYNGKSTLGEYAKEGGKEKGALGKGIGGFADTDAGVGSVKESKNTVINISFDALNKGGIQVHAAGVTEGAAQIEAIFMKMFTGMINNSQIIAGS